MQRIWVIKQVVQYYAVYNTDCIVYYIYSIVYQLAELKKDFV